MDQKIKKCICIKEGKMKYGRMFAYKGKYYEYIFEEGQTHGYNVKTEGQGNFTHSMSKSFFQEYFVDVNTILLPEGLFEI